MGIGTRQSGGAVFADTVALAKQAYVCGRIGLRELESWVEADYKWSIPAPAHQDDPAQSRCLDGAERVRLARLARFQRSATATHKNTSPGSL